MKTLIISFLLNLVFISMVYATGSMRIEVEVYNGPLSKSIEIQKAELVGATNITEHVLANLTRAIHVSECRLGCFGDKLKLNKDDESGENFSRCSTALDDLSAFPYSQMAEVQQSLSDVDDQTIYPQQIRQLYPELFREKRTRTLSPHYEKDSNGNDIFYWTQDIALIPTKNDDARHQVCPQLADVKLNVLNVLEYMAKTNVAECRSKLLSDNSGDNNLTGESLTCLSQIANIGKLLTEGAEHWATTQVAILPNNKRTRIAIARTAVTAAELGNEISARADAIVKQEQGADFSELLPTSVFLRDSEGTDYLNMFEWLDATPRNTRNWPTQSRTRMIERLINDNNWSRINTAFAQGQGKVNMVFVKDDIGNWNLKNYDNDPREMLQAYKQIGTNLFTSAAKLAANATTGTDVINKLADVGRVTQQGENMLFAANNSTNDNDAAKMEERTKQRINNTYKQYSEQMVAAKLNIEKLQTEITTKTTEIEAVDSEISDILDKQKSLQDAITSNQVELDKKETNLKVFLENYPDGNITDKDEHSDRVVEISQSEKNLAASKEELALFNTENQEKLEQHQKLITDITQLKIKLNFEQEKLSALPSRAILVIEEILNSHQSNLKALQENIVSQLN
jgi:hypothetical protein